MLIVALSICAIIIALFVATLPLIVSNDKAEAKTNTQQNYYQNFNDNYIERIGNIDCSTGWWQAFSAECYNLPIGQRMQVEFINHNLLTGNNWNNYCVIIGASSSTSSPPDSEYFVVRSDNYGWGDFYDPDPASHGADVNWDTFVADMHEANVVAEFEYDNNEFLHLRFTIYTTGGSVYHVFYKSMPINDTAVKIAFTVDLSCVDIMKVVNPTPIGDHTISVESDGNGEAFADVTIAKAGDTVTLSATPNDGYFFYKWSSDDVVVATDNTFIMPDSNVSVLANFRAKGGSCGDETQYQFNPEKNTLTIYGNGDVTSSPWLDYPELIKNVVFTEGPTSLGDSAFKDCVNLETVKLPDTMTDLGNGSFTGCAKLKSLNIPKDVTEFPSEKFAEGSGIEEIIFNSEEPPTFADDCFVGLALSGKIYVPAGTLDAYKTALANCGLDFSQWQIIENQQPSPDPQPGEEINVSQTSDSNTVLIELLICFAVVAGCSFYRKLRNN